MYLYMSHIYKYAYVHTQMHKCTYYVYLCTYLYVLVNVHVCVSVHLYMCLRMCVCVPVVLCVNYEKNTTNFNYS